MDEAAKSKKRGNFITYLVAHCPSSFYSWSWKNSKIWTAACDLVINNFIVKYHADKNISLPDDYLYDKAFDDMMVEEVYNLLNQGVDDINNKNGLGGFKGTGKNFDIQKKFGNYCDANDAIGRLAGGQDPKNAFDEVIESDPNTDISGLKQDIISSAEYCEKTKGDIPALR